MTVTLKEDFSMNAIRCDVSEGPRQGYKVVGVSSVEGYTEYLTIEERFLVHRDGEFYLPVQVVGNDAQHGTALIQLPYEADSGANRIWVEEDALNPTEIPA